MIEVVAGIIEDGRGHILVAQRPPGKKLAGLWEFPGGKIEAGETPDKALQRELQEELALDVRTERALGVFPHTYDWGSIRLHVYVVSALNTPRPSADVQVFRWLKPEDVSERDLAAADIEPLRLYLRSISRPGSTQV